MDHFFQEFEPKGKHNTASCRKCLTSEKREIRVCVCLLMPCVNFMTFLSFEVRICAGRFQENGRTKGGKQSKYTYELE
jgi:hypothetical protein